MTDRQLKVLEWLDAGPGKARFREELGLYWVRTMRMLDESGLTERFDKGKVAEFWQLTSKGERFLEAVRRGN